jgi:hypothetical protein
MQPPGTGKTKTIVETVKVLKAHFQVPEPLLVCTFTNVAVDNLVERLADAGLRPLRASSAGKVKPSLQEHTLEWKMEQHPSRPELKRLVVRAEVLEKELATLRVALADLRTKVVTDTATDRELKRAKRMEEDLVRKERMDGALKRRIYGLERSMLKEILDSADVVCLYSTEASLKLTLITVDLYNLFNLGLFVTEPGGFPHRLLG